MRSVEPMFFQLRSLKSPRIRRCRIAGVSLASLLLLGVGQRLLLVQPGQHGMQLGVANRHRLQRFEQARAEVGELPGDALAAPAVVDVYGDTGRLRQRQ